MTIDITFNYDRTSNKSVCFSCTMLHVLDNSITPIQHPPYRLKGIHTTYGDITRVRVSVFFSVLSLCNVYSNTSTVPKTRTARGGRFLQIRGPFLPPRRTSGRWADPAQNQAAGLPAQGSHRNLFSARVVEQGRSHAAAQDPPLHTRSFKPLKIPQKPEGSEL